MRKSFAMIFFWVFFLNVANVYAEKCPFCNQQVIENQYAFKSEYFYVMVDYAPRAKGHLIAVPKRHMMMLHELTQEEWTDLYIVVPKIVKFFSEYLSTDQYIVLEKNGPNAYQNVPHVHFHFFPVTDNKWSEIFDITPKVLNPQELKNEVNLIRSYF